MSKQIFYKAPFINFDIKTVNENFFWSLYDKRNFPFSIVRIPYLCNIMPSKIFCTSLRVEILRIEKFKSSCAKIIFRKIKEEGTKTESGQDFQLFTSFFATNDIFYKIPRLTLACADRISIFLNDFDIYFDLREVEFWIH